MAKTQFTHADLESLWVLHGGSQASADTAAAIAQAESGGCLYAKAGPTDDRPEKICTYRKTTKENSYGLWQINRQAHPQYTAASLYTAAGNANAAVAIAKGGTSFGAWSTYTSGAYKAYLTIPQPTPTPTGGGTAGASIPPPGTRATKAWRNVLRSLDHTVPTELRRSAANRRRLSRV